MVIQLSRTRRDNYKRRDKRSVVDRISLWNGESKKNFKSGEKMKHSENVTRKYDY